MKLLILGDANSSHILKWVSGLKSKGVTLAIYSLTPLQEENAHYYKNVAVRCSKQSGKKGRLAEKTLLLKALPKIKALHQAFKPDIVHAHYAYSYGLLGALCGFSNYMISVWGTDVYVSPKSNHASRKMLKYSLSKADVIFSTSHDMARETKLYTNKPIQIIPFGVTVEDFNADASKFDQEGLVFSTAKSLRPVYNIPLVIKVFKDLNREPSNSEIKLFIAGDGPQMSLCRDIAGDLIGQSIFFEGAVLHKKMPKFFHNKHVLINIPESESFGVSVLEASASGMAVIATNRGGLPEVCLNGETGILIDEPFEENLRTAMEHMIDDRAQTKKMAQNGRRFVADKYAWSGSVDRQYQAYLDFLNR
jgi:glycosyltransferase involved in cell wall biosynthesis